MNIPIIYTLAGIVFILLIAYHDERPILFWDSFWIMVLWPLLAVYLSILLLVYIVMFPWTR